MFGLFVGLAVGIVVGIVLRLCRHRISVIAYRLLKLYLLKVQSKRMSGLSVVAFTLFVDLALDAIYNEGGLLVAIEAIKGWRDNFSMTLSQKLRGENSAPVKIRFEETSATLDVGFTTLAQLVTRLRPIIGAGPVRIFVNNKPSSLGRWLRPDDDVVIERRW